MDSITVNRNPSSDEDFSNKKYSDDELDKNSVLTFNQTLDEYPKVSVENHFCNLTKCDKIQNIGATVIKYPNQER